MRRIAISIAAALAAAGAQAWAQPANGPPPEAVEALYACTAVEDASARLACYDAAAARFRQAQSDGSLIAIDRQQVETIQRESFGFSLPSVASLVPRFGDQEAGPETVELEVASVVTRADRRTTFVMADGQRWTQIESRSARNVRPGDIVRIRRAAMGSFMLVSSRGGAGHRVRREQ